MYENFINKVQSTYFSRFDSLSINKIKPLDVKRFNRKIMIIGQNPSNKRSCDDKIFEHNNPSDVFLKEFLSYLSLSRDSVYITNLIKISLDNINDLTDKEIDNYRELLYEEIAIIKPYIIIFISQYSYSKINIEKLKCPVIVLNHPSYYLRKGFNGVKMFEDLKTLTLNEHLQYNFSINFTNNSIQFRNESSLREFFSCINFMKIFNISLDSNFNPIAMFVSNKKVLRVQFKYYEYSWIECNEKEAEKYTLLSKPCKKVFNKFLNKENCYEYDIHQDYRFIIDYYDYFESIKKEEINYITFDIETNNSVDVINTPKEIISIVYLLDNKYEFLILNNTKNNFEIFKDKNNVKVFDEEKEMILYFMNVIRKCNIVTGFNILGFDLIYLLNRSKLLGLNESKFSPILKIKNNIREEKDRMDDRNIDISGLDIIDTMQFAKNKFFIYSLDKPSQYNLDYLGNYLSLGRKVKDSRGPSVLWLEDPLKLYEYNIQDVKLCRDIENYMSMLDYLLSFKQLMSTFNVKWSLHNSKIIDFFILCNYSQYYVFPSKKEHLKKELEGAFVMEPISGIYNNVAVLDFAALYPNIIRQFNISYETVSKNKFDNSLNIDDKFFINISKTGLCNEIVDKLMIMKDEYGIKLKENYNEVTLSKYNAIKAVINGVYGVFGYKYFRLYNNEVAESITYIGRKLLKWVIEKSKELNVIPIYGDTDSVLLYSKDKVDFFKITEYLNNEVSNYVKKEFKTENKYLKLECETIFENLLMTNAKKKYYGEGYFVKGKKFNELKEYGRGIDLVKKDTPLKMRPIIKELLTSIIRSKNNDYIIRNSILKAKEEINKLNYKDLLITRQISRELSEYKVEPQHVKGMLYSNKYFGTKFSRSNYKGGMIYVKVKQKYPQTDIVMTNDDLTLPNEIQINHNKYFELFIENKMSLFMKDFEKYFNKNQSLLQYK